MPRFNYHHLHYFWVVAREGGITPASRVLGVTQPTISTQVASLEEALGATLVRRMGNRLELTDLGRMVQHYAADIFALGDQLQEAVVGHQELHPARLAVGIHDVLPLLSAHRLLEPALELPPTESRLVLRTDKQDRLLSALTARTLDLVLTDTPAATSPLRVAHSHPLQTSDVTLFAKPELAKTLKGPFPRCLDGAPFIFHTENTSMRRGLDGWLARHDIHPVVAGEVENVALLQMLGKDGRGVFAAPSLVEDELCQTYGVVALGRTEEVVERFDALTLEREPTNPGVRRILDALGAEAPAK